MRPSDILKRSISYQDLFDTGADLDWSGGSAKAGVRVTAESASALSQVYAAVRIISEAVASLPPSVIERSPGELPVTLELPEWARYPNPEQTWLELVGEVMVSLLYHGNAYVLVDWAKGSVSDLTVLNPGSCSKPTRGVVRVSAEGRSSDFVEASAARPAPSSGSEILHLRGVTKPGEPLGMSPITAHAETLGISLAAQSYGADWFANSATPSGLIELPADADLSEVGKSALRRAWRDLFGADRGQRNSVAVLTRGAQFKQLQVTPNEAQFLQTREYGVSEVARIFGLPPHMLGDMRNTTGWGTGMAEQNLAFVTHTLRTWIERAEARFSILVERELRNSKARLRLSEEQLLRGATRDRWDTLRANVAAGLMTADEARAAEGIGPLPDGIGAVPWVPLSQAPDLGEDEAEQLSLPLEEGEL